MKVSIGRIVIVVTVVNGEHKPLPAIVVMVHDNDDDAVDVQMFSDRHAGHSFLPEVRHETSRPVDSTKDMFWIWPPRES